jgi:hypothetical protein
MEKVLAENLSLLQDEARLQRMRVAQRLLLNQDALVHIDRLVRGEEAGIPPNACSGKHAKSIPPRQQGAADAAGEGCET